MKGNIYKITIEQQNKKSYFGHLFTLVCHPYDGMNYDLNYVEKFEPMILIFWIVFLKLCYAGHLEVLCKSGDVSTRGARLVTARFYTTAPRGNTRRASVCAVSHVTLWLYFCFGLACCSSG